MYIIYRHHRPNPAILQPPSDQPWIIIVFIHRLNHFFTTINLVPDGRGPGYNTGFRIFFSRGFSIKIIIIMTITQAPGNNINNNYY